MTDDPYVWPGTSILRNKLGIRDAGELERVERLLTTQRAAAGVPTGDFDLAHLRAIHRHLFSRVYDWAGELRTVEIAKGGHQFMFANISAMEWPTFTGASSRRVISRARRSRISPWKWVVSSAT